MIPDDYNAMDVFGARYGAPCPPNVRAFYEAMFARVDAEIAATYSGDVSPATRNALYIEAVHDDCPEFADTMWSTSLAGTDAAIAAFEAKYPARPAFSITTEDVERALEAAPLFWSKL